MIYLICALTSLALCFAAQQTVGIFQSESYKRPQLKLRLSEDPSPRQTMAKRLRLLALLQSAALVLAYAVIALVSGSGTFVPDASASSWMSRFSTFAACAFGTVSLVALIVWFLRWRKQPAKKPMKYTTRIWRLNAALLVVLVALQLVLVLVASIIVYVLAYTVMNLFGSASLFSQKTAGLLFYTMPVLAVVLMELVCAVHLPRLLALASILVQPIETAVKNWYFNDARRKLAGYTDMVKIGITGSYGKTSAKVILATILSEKYKTMATPSSYNTPMGVTRVIREQLDASYQVFIAEMGARHVGDIAEMCRLVAPRWGLLTSVGPQHLETFGSLDKVAKTKYELIDALPADGMGFFPSDNEICVSLYQNTQKPKALFGIEGEGLYMTARDIEHGAEGGSFMLVGPDGATVRCRTKLLGRHNIQNILGCAAVAYALGLTLEEIARGVAKAEPVEHRLQLIPTTNGITVIDDAFNSNPSGARAALDVLKSFPGRKIIITPGLVELGETEAAENEAFGRAMAGAVDVAILVARNGEAMRRGLVAAGYDEGNIFCVGSLSAATAALGSISRSGDVVLFENDLPDHYEQ